MISYDTALCFQYVNGNTDASASIPTTYINLNGYRPIMRLVGKTSEKVYIADGARWWSGGASFQPDTNGAVMEGSPGGMASDYGPWEFYSRSYQKGSATASGRPAAMRHGDGKPGGKLASFKFNLAFFDGHVETLNGLDGADPSLWVPHGGKPAVSEYISDNDFVSRYGQNPSIR
jgi:prepilin-type processing-associated H-X9-DG protein